MSKSRFFKKAMSPLYDKWFGDAYGPKPCKFIWSGGTQVHHVPKPCKFKWSVMPMVKGIPKWFFGRVVFWRLGVVRQTNHVFKKIMVLWPCRRRRQGQKTTICLKMCGCLAFVPQASKKHLAKKPLRDPCDHGPHAHKLM